MKSFGTQVVMLLFVASVRAQTTSPVINDSRALLGPVYESPAAGIALRGPAGAKQIRRSGGDEIVQFIDDDKKWNLVVTRAQLSSPAKLTPYKNDAGEEVPGLLDTTVKQLLIDKGSATILRQDVVNFGDVSVGMIAAKYTLGLDTFLMQQALVRVTDRHYFVLTFITPAPRTGELEDDPQTRNAVETFSAVLDSLRLLDQTAIKEDQSQRLFRTRTLFLSLGEQRLRDALVPVQWLRVIENGKDVGYTYIVEEVAHDLPRKSVRPERQSGPEGVLIGLRSRTLKGGVMLDSESWMFCTFDRKNESWSSIALVDDPKIGRTHLSELGVSTRRTKAVPAAKGSVLRDGNKGVTLEEEYILSVTQMGKSGDAEPVQRELPVFYLPQALGHLLPRLLPRNDPKGYLFASYVTEKGQVMTRYIDLGREEQVSLAGRTVRAIPIRDRIGLEGSVTTHYITQNGKYLGSVNSDSHLTVLPSDSETLEKLWKDANLTRPEAVEEK